MPHTVRANAALAWPPGKRRCLGGALVALLLLLLAGAASIPFLFESSSILYKFGADKLMLRAGKVLGMIAAALVLFQLILSARIKFLDRIFALDRLLNAHRIIGTTLACCLILHPVLIFLPDDMLFIPFEWRYWPEFVGLFLLLSILGMAVSGNFRAAMGIRFDLWWMMHRMAAAAVAIALFVHILFVSETFERGFPRTVVFVALALYAVLYLWVKLKRLVIRRRPYTISLVKPAGREAFQLRISPNSRDIRPYAPGQFALIRIHSPHISSEEHPFTIAASPARSSDLEFVIRTSGDWTRHIGRIRPGDLVSIDGPYGLFTHLRCPENREIIMIAGGIGITPMLSMLRYMSDIRDQRKITLVWSNRTRAHIVLPEEFKAFENSLPGLDITHILTEDPVSAETERKLERSRLERLLSGCSRQAMVFLCGPPQMMTEIEKVLVQLGFSRWRIFTERFGF